MKNFGMQRHLVKREEFSSDGKANDSIKFVGDGSLPLRLSSLGQFGRVLYVGAHPDDENNKLIAYLTKERFFETAYLSITRGEGGQNFIGAESGDELGLLRVQESLQARSVDGGRQFFTGARDYGFSKCADDAIAVWGRTKTLEDIVFVLRHFQPDIIICRFSPHIKDKHGHHQASAILTEKAFSLASDGTAFPDQLKKVKLWQPKQLLWNVYAESGVKEIGGQIRPTDSQTPLFIPARNRFLNKCYSELAAESRNQHRCQAMASMSTRTASFEYFEWLAGAPLLADDIFNVSNGNNLQFHRENFVKQLDELGNAVVNGLAVPEIVRRLILLLRFTDRYEEDHRMVEKRSEIVQLLVDIIGLEATISVDRSHVCPGEDIVVSLNFKKQSLQPVRLHKVQHNLGGMVHTIDVNLNQLTNVHINSRVALNVDYASAPWLKSGSSRGRYLEHDVEGVTTKTKGEQLIFDLQFVMMDQSFTLQVPAIAGPPNASTFLRKEPVVVGPPIVGLFEQDSILITSEEPTAINLKLKSSTLGSIKGAVRLTAGPAVTIFPATVDFQLKPREERTLSFSMDIGQKNWEGTIGFEIEVDGHIYNETTIKIDYPHIVPQQYFKVGEIKVVKASVDVAVNKIAYIRGSDDAVATALQKIVTQVDIFDVPGFLTKDLQQYEAVVLGIRLYNCIGGCQWHVDKKLRSYVESGGLVISQYNTDYDLNGPSVGPYGIQLSANRITNAASPVHFLQAHSVLTYPNRLTQADFEDWSHDRALFLPTYWDSDFIPVLQSADRQGELEESLLLIAKKGKGHYVYTALSLFRQLPLAVAGAYRLFANLLSLQ